MVWPRVRFALGESRWKTLGKKPSIFEKWWGARWGVVLVCFVVKDASSRAIKRPKSVTIRAASLRRGGIDITGVFIGKMFVVIRRPATMLPHAKRLMGLITAGLFSLMGEKVLNRG